jgi:secreted Zn-dependent insulinase-like peptidase
MGDVDEIADTHLDILLTNTSMPVKECLEELEGYEYITFYGLIEDFWKRARLEWVVVGNFPKEFIPVLNAHELNILR